MVVELQRPWVIHKVLHGLLHYKWSNVADNSSNYIPQIAERLKKGKQQKHWYDHLGLADISDGVHTYIPEISVMRIDRLEKNPLIEAGQEYATYNYP